jgi:hypothetical protein
MKNLLITSLYFLITCTNIVYAQVLSVTPLNINKGLIERGYVDINDNLVLGTEMGIFIFDDSVELQQISPLVSRVFEGKYGNIIYTNDSLNIYSWYQGNLTTITFDSLHLDIDPGSNSNQLFSAIQLNDDRLMLEYGTGTFSLVRFVDTTATITVQYHPNLSAGGGILATPNFQKIGTNQYLNRSLQSLFTNTVFDESLDQFLFISDTALNVGTCQPGNQWIYANYPLNNHYYSRTDEGVYLMNGSNIIKQQCFDQYGYSVPFSRGIGASHPISNDFYVADKTQLLRSDGDTIIRYSLGQGFDISFLSDGGLLDMDFNSVGDMYIFHRSQGIYKINTSVLSSLSKQKNIGKHKIYPNPASDRIVIEFGNHADANTTISIFNLHGKNVLNRSIDIVSGTSTLHFSESLVAGLYHYVIQLKDDIVYRGNLLIE